MIGKNKSIPPINESEKITDSRDDESDKEKKSTGNKGFGIIETSIFKYLTPLMIIIATVVTGLVVSSAGTLWEYFATNVYLNGLIIFLMTLALFKAFYNNYELYKTAKFLKKMQGIAEADEPDDQKVNDLHDLMYKQAALLDTQNMHNAIENIKTFGHPNFTDNDARLIKHKLGYRIRLKKADVGFVAGILVMLGLLGTFLGLLKTIDSVGAAMSSMSSLGGGGGGVDENAMTDFISSLSAPLQGMGLAFSSSLFGLTGSLLIGYFNHLCARAQDKFIENAGRWIDDRIPSFKPLADTSKKGSKPAKDDDLKTWLAGYVYLSVKTNKKIGRLTHSLLETIKGMGQNEAILNRLANNQEKMTQSVIDMSDSVRIVTTGIGTHSEQITTLLKDNNSAVMNLSHSVKEQKNTFETTIAPVLPALQHSVHGLQETMQQQTGAIRADMSDFKARSLENAAYYAKILEQIDTKFTTCLDMMGNSYQGLTNELKSMQSAKQSTAQPNNENAERQNEQLISTMTELLKATQASTEQQKNIIQSVEKLEETNAKTSQIDQKTGEYENMVSEIDDMISELESMNDDKISRLLSLAEEEDEDDDES